MPRSLILMLLALSGCASGSSVTRTEPRTTHDVGQSQSPASLRFELFVTDLAASVDFYKRLLGFSEDRRSPDYVSLSLGKVILGLGPVAKLGPAHYFRPGITQTRRGLGVEIVLEVDDVRAAEQRLRSAGYPLVRGLTKQSWGLTDFRIADPDGYFIRVTSREETPIRP